MIVRIATEGQYEVGESDTAELNDLDNQAVAACESGNEQQFSQASARLLELVRTKGKPGADDGCSGLT